MLLSCKVLFSQKKPPKIIVIAFMCSAVLKGEDKKVKFIDLTLSVLAVLVRRHVVDSVPRRAVGGGAVGLGAGQGGQSGHGGDTGETLQALDVVHALAAAGGHASRGLKAACEGGDGVVALGLMWHAAWVKKTHDLMEEMK